MNLFEAEVVVTTREKIDSDPYAGDWFRLSDYGDMEEFLSACCSFFPDEENPVFRYPAWKNIPDNLINKEWLCPNFFEIRDALERLDEAEVECFVTWCGYHSHNIATDDPYVLVARYQDNQILYPESESEAMEMSDDALAYQDTTVNFSDVVERYSFKVYTDNYS